MFNLNNNLVSKTILRYRARIFQGYVVIALIIFAILAAFSHFILYFNFDLTISRAVQSINFLGFNELMQLVTLPGNPPIFAFLMFGIVIILFLFKLKWESVSMAAVSVSVFILGTVLKDLVHRARPTTNLVSVFTNLKDWGFPSGHVLSYTVCFGFLVFLVYSLLPHSRRRTVLLIFLILLIILVSFSRVYLGEHWPSDTLGAYLIGSVWLWVSIKFYNSGKLKYFRKTDPQIVIPPEISHTSLKKSKKPQMPLAPMK